MVVNYHSIAITSHNPKFFESLVSQSIKSSINNILVDGQHGFRPDRSPITWNMVFVNYIMNAFRHREQVYAIYIDFFKAFDRVDHDILIRILILMNHYSPGSVLIYLTINSGLNCMCVHIVVPTLDVPLSTIITCSFFIIG